MFIAIINYVLYMKPFIVPTMAPCLTKTFKKVTYEGYLVNHIIDCREMFYKFVPLPEWSEVSCGCPTILSV